MSDLGIPLTVAGAIGVAGSAAIRALWTRVKDVETRERTDCAERISKIEERVQKLETQRDDCEERWRREVRRGATLAARVRLPDEPPPSEIPPPDWDESTDVRNVRQELERHALDEELRNYAESTPPRQRMPSRPR